MRKLLLALLISTPVFADLVDIAWVAPTQYADNSALSGGDILGYEINSPSGIIALPASPLSYTYSPTTVGSNCFAVRAEVVGGAKSAWTAESCVTVVSLPGDGIVITSVNSGTAIPDNGTQIPIAVTGAAGKLIRSCYINNNTAGTFKVNWDYATAASGLLMDVGDIDQYITAPATLYCNTRHFTRNYGVGTANWTASSATEAAYAGGSKWGYTTGITLTSTATSTRGASYATGAGDVPAAAGIDIEYMIEYSLNNPAHQVYLGVKDASHASVADPRNEATGTAGALVKRTLNGGFGTGFDIENQTLGDGVYRVYLRWTTGADNSTPDYNIRVGNYSQVSGHSINIHRAVYTENPASGAQVSKAVTLAISDTTAPTVSNCTLLSFADVDNPGMYRATINCDTTELGGDYFVMLKDTNVAPADSDVVIAGTGALRSATGPVDGLTISAEFSGLSYQDLWAYAVHRDAATLKSSVASATFSDGVTYVKRIKFANSATRLRTRDGATFGGALDFFTLHPTDPRLPGPKTDLVVIDNPTITAGIPNFTEADTQCETCSGSINALPLGQYWYSARSEDGTVKSVNTINIVDAAE